ncbi:MAG: ABC transporter ATP-binding protein [Proteobacteria bacterium]|nr:ABC transporter ATP-binding protein [Pseudomonadota bacterium]
MSRIFEVPPIQVHDLVLDYPMEMSLGIMRPLLGRPPAATKRALDSIGFHIKEGERVGIIGHNGAGKSTLLKVLTGILPSTSGRVDVRGVVAPLFEFATGFEMELTGRENIYIRGLLQGLTLKQIEERIDGIIDFSELGDAINDPVRTYSTGMFVRLAFSTATSIDPDILLIDEAYGAGDQEFANKSAKRMRELMDRGRILVFTSHNMDLIRSLCTRVMWLDHGRIVMDGSVDEVISSYLKANA